MERTELRKRGLLDQKDLEILDALDQLGGNATAQEISEFLSSKNPEQNYPARTIRYRVSMLTERGILLPQFLQTHERRIGLGEGILLVQEGGSMSEVLERVARNIPIFYWFFPTIGQFNGLMIHTIHDVQSPDMIHNIARVMIETGLIKDYSFFDIVDYATKSVDFRYYQPEGGWDWNWKRWYNNIQSNLQEQRANPFVLQEDQPLFECDEVDITILKHMKINPNVSMRELASITQAPLPEVRERVQKLRENGVIRGSKRAYGLIGELLWVSCFLRMNDNVGGVMQCIRELPFPGGILMHDNERYCVQLGLDADDLKPFLEGLRMMGSFLDSYSIQIHLADRVEAHYLDMFDYFDKEEKRWKIPVEEYLRMITKKK